MEEIPRGIFYSPGSMLMLEEVVLPDSVKKFGYRAFCNCGYLKEITLPKKPGIYRCRCILELYGSEAEQK